MKSGSVTVDLAAESGGNIETTVKDEKIITDNGVTCLGYTDLASRLPTTSSSLYSNNISKFLLSIGPQTTKVKDFFYIDHEDDAVRGTSRIHFTIVFTIVLLFCHTKFKCYYLCRYACC